MKLADGPTLKAPAVFQGFWHGPPLGPVRTACLRSFIRRGHRFELYVYGAVEVPAGVALRDAAEIIPQSEIFYFQNPFTGKPDIGPFSDLFRFKLLFERGGWWSDVDTVCLSAQMPDAQRAWGRECPEMRDDGVGTSQIAFPRGDAAVKLLYERCLALSKGTYPRRESLGPMLITDTLRDLGLPADNIGSAALFYPVRWIEMFKPWLPHYVQDMAARAARALFMPIYQSFLHYTHLSWSKLPPHGSFLAQVCEEAGIVGGERHDAREIMEATRNFFQAHGNWPIAELRTVGGEADLRFLGLAQ